MKTPCWCKVRRKPRTRKSNNLQPPVLSLASRLSLRGHPLMATNLPVFAHFGYIWERKTGETAHFGDIRREKRAEAAHFGAKMNVSRKSY
ncbi:hypothetical protein ES703_04128 [subsurface metagenome]